MAPKTVTPTTSVDVIFAKRLIGSMGELMQRKLCHNRSQEMSLGMEPTGVTSIEDVGVIYVKTQKEPTQRKLGHNRLQGLSLGTETPAVTT
jgi:hypothetical protein